MSDLIEKWDDDCLKITKSLVQIVPLKNLELQRNVTIKQIDDLTLKLKELEALIKEAIALGIKES